jgi:tetratricopeptide (TPR) repeat protein
MKGLFDLSIADLNKAIDINPVYAEAYNNRGYAYKSKGLFDLAISDFNRALEINPRYADAYNNRGNAYHNKRKYEEAMGDVDNIRESEYQVNQESPQALLEAYGREE